MRKSPPTLAYAFCEPSFQTGIRSQIRRVGTNGELFPHGGIPAEFPGLCGLDLAKGWDTQPPVSTNVVRELLARNWRAEPGGDVVCAGCAEAYLAAVPE